MNCCLINLKFEIFFQSPNICFLKVKQDGDPYTDNKTMKISDNLEQYSNDRI